MCIWLYVVYWPQGLKASFCVSAQLIKEDVTMKRRLSLATPIPRMIFTHPKISNSPLRLFWFRKMNSYLVERHVKVCHSAWACFLTVLFYCPLSPNPLRVVTWTWWMGSNNPMWPLNKHGYYPWKPINTPSKWNYTLQLLPTTRWVSHSKNIIPIAIFHVN